MQLKQRTLLLVASSAFGLCAPCTALAQRLELGAAAWAAQGNSSTGTGLGVGLDGRLRGSRQDWFALVGRVSATGFGEVDLPAERSVLQATTTVVAVGVGPELAHRLWRLRALANVLSGVSVVNTTATFRPTDIVYPFGRVRSAAPYLEFGAGILAPLSDGVALDVGVRRILTRATVWARNPQGSFGGSAPLPDLEYRRRLSANHWSIGVRFGAAAR